jgi:uncharacterized protein
LELPQIIERLSDPAACPDLVAAVEVRQTQISAVFLAGRFMCELEKPVAPGCLDFSTLGRRRH